MRVDNIFFGILLFGLMAFTSGCANHATATLTPGASLCNIKSFYLIPGQEDKDNYLLIKSNLEKRGFAVTIGPETLPPYKADAVATYIDKWMWDITMYMLELTVTLRNPIDNSPLAVGNSLHTSLTRKSAEEMVDEVLTNIFNVGCPTMTTSGSIGTDRASIPANPSRKLIVRDINWKETAISELDTEQIKVFTALQPQFNHLFHSEFDKHIKKDGRYESVVYGNNHAATGSNTLILAPKIYTLKPLGFMPGASYTGLLMSTDDKLIGKYSEERRLSGSSTDPEKIKQNIEQLLKELAEDAAAKLPYSIL